MVKFRFDSGLNKMPSVKELLLDLSFGGSVAEFDADLKNYFLETQPFRQLVADERDIVAGDKGTGKTAIFKVLHDRYPHMPQLRHVIVVPAFNTSGNPIFQDLAAKGAQDEGDYIVFWKAFILALVGNWLLRHNKYDRKSRLHQLDMLLRGLALRSDLDAPRSVFQKVMDKTDALFSWQAAELQFEAGVEGVSVTPRVEFDKKTGKNLPLVPISGALTLLNACLADTGKVAWVSIDRLDEAFQGYAEAEIPALRALFRSYLDLLEFERIKLKLFVRRDLFRRIVGSTFVNLTHINARKVEVIWDEEDLLTLLSRRVRQNKIFCERTKLNKSTDKEIFSALFPEQVDQGSRKPETWVWMMSRIRDGNGIKPPRNLVDLISMAKDAQLRKEEREPREFDPSKPLIEAESLRRALAQLSEQRVNDTLLAEARSQAPLIERFRRGKAEHNEASLSTLLGVRQEDVRATIRPLIELGFLEEIAGTFKVPMLYRGGLEITQGKAFANNGDHQEEDE